MSKEEHAIHGAIVGVVGYVAFKAMGVPEWPSIGMATAVGGATYYRMVYGCPFVTRPASQSDLGKEVIDYREEEPSVVSDDY